MVFQFFGVRGSYPVAGGEVLRTGGNTASVLVELPPDGDGGGETLILDAGTGIIGIGKRWAGSPDSAPRRIHLFLSHLHWDHVQGLPFFAPLYDASTTIRVHSVRPEGEIRDGLAAQMSPPHFPIPFEQTRAALEISRLDGPCRLGSATLEAFPLCHPGGSAGLRITAAGRTLAYATDHEVGRDADADRALREAAAGCDALILDAHFDPQEKAARNGWGHSSWRDAAAAAKDAGAERLFLFHHAPDAGDEQLEDRLRGAREIHPGAELAVEGKRVELG